MEVTVRATNSERQRHALRDRGYVKLPDVLDPADVRALRAAVDGHARAAMQPGPYGLIYHNPWREVAILAHVLAERLAPLARHLLDVDAVVLFQDIFISKPPGTDAVQWHQDYSYWPLDRPDGLTMWLALDHADASNGCLHYIPGTHRLGERQPADFYMGTGQPTRAGLAPLMADERADEAEAVPALAGSVLVHDPLVWHMSPANATQRPRRAWSLSWLSPDVRWQPAHAPHPFEYQLEPRADDPVCGPMFPRFGS